jgi:FkbM family methyltransferase
VKVATLGYGRTDRLVLFAAYIVMPVKSRIPQLAHRLIGVRIRHAEGSAKIWLSDRSELIVLQQVMIDGEYEAVETNHVDTIVDLGANIGISVLWFRARYPNATIIAVEPDPRTFAKLTRNVGDDPLVQCVHAAITTVGEPVPIVSSELSWVSRVDQVAGPNSTTVTGITMDELCTLYALERIDIMKVDIEGMEWHVLPTADCLGRTSEVIGEIHLDVAPEDPDTFFGAIEERFGLRRAVEPSGHLFRLRQPAVEDNCP